MSSEVGGGGASFFKGAAPSLTPDVMAKPENSKLFRLNANQQGARAIAKVQRDGRRQALLPEQGRDRVRLIVTNLDADRASEILNLYARRWAVECTFKELKSGLHWGQMQVTKEKERVKRAMLLPVMAYLPLLRLYGKELDPDQGFTIFQLKRRFCDQAWQEQLDRSEAKWRKKLDEYKAAA